MNFRFFSNLCAKMNFRNLNQIRKLTTTISKSDITWDKGWWNGFMIGVGSVFTGGFIGFSINSFRRK